MAVPHQSFIWSEECAKVTRYPHLNIMMLEAKYKNLFDGVRVGSKGVVISHLQYADDSFFVGAWDNQNLQNLIRVLKCFQLMWGLNVNMSKCRLIGVGVEDVVVEDAVKENRMYSRKASF